MTAPPLPGNRRELLHIGSGRRAILYEVTVPIAGATAGTHPRPADLAVRIAARRR